VGGDFKGLGMEFKGNRKGGNASAIINNIYPLLNSKQKITTILNSYSKEDFQSAFPFFVRVSLSSR